jgi:hypothetical protein
MRGRAMGAVGLFEDGGDLLEQSGVGQLPRGGAPMRLW